VGTYNNTSMQILQNGSNAIFIDTSKNIGIGTTSPSAPLNIVNSNPKIVLEDSDNANTFGQIRQQAGNLQFLSNNNTSNGTIQFKLNNGATTVDVMNIISNGNVGIGTTNPTRKLDVAGDMNLALSAVALRIGGTAVLGVLNNYTRVNGTGGASGGIVFTPNNDNNEKVRITGDGNVGIGTTSPSEKLEVAGGGRFEGMTVKGTNSSYWLYDRDLNNRGQESFRITRNVGSVTFYDRTYSGGYEELDFLKFNHSTSGSSVLSLKSKTTIDFLINQSNVARINSSGNVGIGTTAPTTKLHVDGDIRIQGENQLYLGGTGSVPHWEITASGSDLIVNDTGTNVGSVLFNNDEGVALPRLTTTEINAISSPTQGLMAYNTTLNTICFYNGSSWQKVSHTSM